MMAKHPMHREASPIAQGYRRLFGQSLLAEISAPLQIEVKRTRGVAVDPLKEGAGGCFYFCRAD